MEFLMKSLKEIYTIYREVLLEYENYLMWKFPEYDCIIREHDKNVFEVVFMVRDNKMRSDHTFFVTLDQMESLAEISDTEFLPKLVKAR